MTGVSPFLFFHKHTIITIKDATLMSQSFTHMDAGTQTPVKSKDKDVGYTTSRYEYARVVVNS